MQASIEPEKAKLSKKLLEKANATKYLIEAALLNRPLLHIGCKNDLVIYFIKYLGHVG